MATLTDAASIVLWVSYTQKTTVKTILSSLIRSRRELNIEKSTRILDRRFPNQALGTTPTSR